VTKKLEVDKPKGKTRTPKKPRKPLKERIPVLPPLEIDPEAITRPDTRAAAVVNLRMVGTPWPDVVKELGYASVQSAQNAYYSALASLHPVENWEVLRQVEGMRAENLLGQAMRMASADYLVDDKGNRIANSDKLRWHDQALKALQVHATITGAKAPARVEVSASTQELNAMVQVLMQQHQGEIESEASIWDIEDVEDAEIVEDTDGRDLA
jgi:hypothetical protein